MLVWSKMHCPKCLSTEIRKNGIVRGKQRILCKSCKLNYCNRDRRGHPEFLLGILNFILNNKDKIEHNLDPNGRLITDVSLLYTLSLIFGVDIKIIKSLMARDKSKILSRGFIDFSIKTSNLSDYDTLLIRFEEFVIVAANRYDPRLAAIFDADDSASF